MGVCDRRLGVVHGQHQARAPHHQLVVAVRQLSVQVVGGGGAGEGRAAAGVGARGVGADGDVAVGQVDVAVGQDEVGVVVLQLALILEGEERGGYYGCSPPSALFPSYRLLVPYYTRLYPIFILHP